MPSRRHRRPLPGSGDSAQPGRLRQLRRELEAPKRQPTVAPRLILSLVLVVGLALGLRILSLYLKDGPTLVPENPADESSAPSSFSLPAAPDAAFDAPDISSVAVEESNELVVSGRNVFVPMGRWVALQSPLGWGAFQLREIAAVEGNANPRIECRWRFHPVGAGSLDDRATTTGSKIWPLGSGLDATTPSKEADPDRRVTFECGPIEFVWSQFLGISLPDEPPVAIALTSAATPESIRINAPNRSWVTTSLPFWNREIEPEQPDFPGQPPEPAGS